jgi:hypothetical protein
MRRPRPAWKAGIARAGGVVVNTEIHKIVVVPRFTTFAGERTFLTLPVPIRQFASAEVGAWRGAGIGSSPVLSMQFQISDDLDVWKDLTGAFDPNGETHMGLSLEAAWLRLAVTLTGTDAAFTCWVVGDFATRTPQGHGGSL